jgi:hypothetical protein
VRALLVIVGLVVGAGGGFVAARQLAGRQATPALSPAAEKTLIDAITRALDERDKVIAGPDPCVAAKIDPSDVARDGALYAYAKQVGVSKAAAETLNTLGDRHNLQVQKLEAAAKNCRAKQQRDAGP